MFIDNTYADSEISCTPIVDVVVSVDSFVRTTAEFRSRALSMPTSLISGSEHELEG